MEIMEAMGFSIGPSMRSMNFMVRALDLTF
jgi:hypothetical protein